MGYMATPDVWIYDCHFPDAVNVNSVDQALQALANNPQGTVVVQSYDLMREILLAQGYPPDRADYWVNVAKEREASGFPD